MRNLIVWLLLVSIVISGCGVSPQAKSAVPTATREIVYMDDTPTPPLPTPYPQELPTLNPTLTAFSVRLLAVMLANTDGSLPAVVDPAVLMGWVDQANQVFANSGIRLRFDPGTDVVTLNNDALNTTTNPADGAWETAMQAGREYALNEPGRMVIFFRNTPLPPDDGYPGMDFILMPSSPPEMCGQPDASLLAHQIGHYLGLGNTFNQVYTSLTDAEKAFEDNGSTPGYFDGDGLADTLVDVFVNTSDQICAEKNSITLKDTEVPLPVGNLMSYYYPRSILTPMQAENARYMLALRARSGSVLPTNEITENATQFEDLPLTYRSWCDPQLQDVNAEEEYRWSNGGFMLVPSGYGAICTFTITAPESATYELIVYMANGPDRGAAQVLLDNWFIYDSIDMFSQSVLPSGAISLGKYYLEQGDHTLAFQIINKMLKSTNYFMGFDAFLMRKVEP